MPKLRRAKQFFSGYQLEVLFDYPLLVLNYYFTVVNKKLNTFFQVTKSRPNQATLQANGTVTVYR